jgi:hypothetical protein
MENSMSSDISALEMFTPESVCFKCKKRIQKGEPRAVVMLMRFGVGPGYRDEEPPEYRDEDEETFGYLADSLVTGSIGSGRAESELDQKELDEDRFLESQGWGRRFGLDKSASTAIALHEVCAAEDRTFQIENPWYISSEETRASDSGSSVWTGPGRRLTDLNIRCSDLEGDYNDGLDDGGSRSPALNEAEDRFISERSEANAVAHRVTEEDHRRWMARFLLTPESHNEKSRTLKVWDLWSKGMKQTEIEKRTGTDQSTVSRLIRRGKAMLYSSRAGKK